jgi:hypothetical protein
LCRIDERHDLSFSKPKTLQVRHKNINNCRYSSAKNKQITKIKSPREKVKFNNGGRHRMDYL